jgi:SAM-dependent methyltransferase
MTEQQIKFDDGGAYERYMGDWSQRVGRAFLDWLAPAPGLRWVDVGCGNGAFTELLVDRCAPAGISGVDPSDAQLDFARKRPAGRLAKFERGDAMTLPFPDASFDAAVMALVIFFVPEPAQGVAEMVRVVRPGGSISAYAWDVLGGGFPLEPLRIELRAMGFEPVNPPSVAASKLDAMRDLWLGAGLDAVEARPITVERTFANFDEFWDISLAGSPTLRPTLAKMSPADIEQLKQRVIGRMQVDAGGRVTYSSRANAVKGRVPA